jgi:hypothetical protein
MFIILIALHLIGLWLFVGLDWFDEWRTRRQIVRALAGCEVRKRPSLLVANGADVYRGLAVEINQPIFTITSLLDGGTRVPKDFGGN